MRTQTYTLNYAIFSTSGASGGENKLLVDKVIHLY